MKKYALPILNTVLIALVLGFLIPTFMLLEGNSPDQNVIHINGQAQEEVNPDEVVIRLAIVTNAKEVDDAVSENSDINNNIIANFKDNEDLLVESTRYSVREKYDWDREFKEQKSDGFEVYNTITITSTSIELAGEIVTEAINHGANRIESMSYQFSDENREKLQNDLLSRAVDNARVEANNIAKLMGKKVKEITDIQVNDGYYPHVYRSYAESADMKAGSIPEFAPEMQTINVNARVSFKLK
jgi:uncharacterized protein